MKEMAMKPTRFSKKFTNAYMLVYIRESNLNEVKIFKDIFSHFSFS